MEYLDDCSTTIRHVVRKVAAMEGGLVCLEVTSLQGCSFQMGGLVYNSIPPLGLSLQSSTELVQSPIEFIQKSCDST